MDTIMGIAGNVLGGVLTAIVLGVGGWLIYELRRVTRAVASVETHLKVNGSEDRLPERLRGKALRTLVIEHIVESEQDRALFAAHVRQGAH